MNAQYFTLFLQRNNVKQNSCQFLVSVARAGKTLKFSQRIKRRGHRGTIGSPNRKLISFLI